MSVSINGTGGLTFSDSSVQSTAATGFGFKNRIINGDFRIDQRNAGAAVTGQQYLVDRWRTWFNPGTYSFQQVADAPTGFLNSLKVTKTDTTQSSYGILLQHIEGVNISDLAWGTASASTVTLSFWVKSSVTGTFSGSLNNADTSTRSYVFSYTINSANTWEQKTVTVAGPTSGTWNTNTSTGIQVKFNYGGNTGSVAAGSWQNGDYGIATGATANLGTTNGATFYITGVQLEKGSTATSFDYRPYGTELALCQRYYYKVTTSGSLDAAAVGLCNTTTAARFFVPFPVSMRTNPTALEQTGTASNYNIQYLNTGASCNAVPTFFTATTQGAGVDATLSAGLTAGQAAVFRLATNAYLAWSAEL